MIIKVCGMRDAENIRKMAQADIQWMGFIFYPKSPRYFQSDTIELPKHIKRVGVFVDAPPEEVLQKKVKYKLDYLQLHGTESPELCSYLSQFGQLLKAISIATKEDLHKTENYEGKVDYFLFDTKCKEFGGSGRRFDWTILDAYQGSTPFLLSGGLSPDCLEDLKAFHHPMCMGIDLNSGFERTPGIKDYTLLNRFINQLKQMNHE